MGNKKQFAFHMRLCRLFALFISLHFQNAIKSKATENLSAQWITGDILDDFS